MTFLPETRDFCREKEKGEQQTKANAESLVKPTANAKTEPQKINAGQARLQQFLRQAAQAGRIDFVRTALSGGAGVSINGCDEHGASALFYAAMQGHVEVVKLLLSGGATVDGLTNDDESALFIASRGGHAEVVSTLLESKAKPDQAESVGSVTALYVASLQGYTAIVDLLVAAGANTQLAIKSGAAPLHAACWHGHTGAVTALLKAKADLEQTTSDAGASPLFVAAQQDQLQVVELLLQHKADLHHKNQNGASCLYVAQQNGHEEVQKALLAAGAKEEVPREVRPLSEFQQMEGRVFRQFLSETECKALEALGNAAKLGKVVKRRDGPTHTQDVHSILYLHADRTMQKAEPKLLSKLLQTLRDVDKEKWHVIEKDMEVVPRVIEYHTYVKGGGVTLKDHFDEGSLITTIIMLANESEYEGGRIQTWEADESFTDYALKRGDCLVFPSHKFHCVTQVTKGCRHNVVIEWWDGPEGCEDRRLATFL